MKTLFPILSALLFAGCTTTPEASRALYARHRASEASGVCHVHQVAMTRKTVPIQYGLPSEIESAHANDARMKRFPFTCRSPLGGCVIEPDAPKTAEVSVCPECVGAEQRWVMSHPDRTSE
ncbi:MAG: hypothetical protein JNJ70_03140 [Verrucomicrobiales bacterium]|nr:hypothetical protein [Verrucomicrobiales bacterium]